MMKLHQNAGDISDLTTTQFFAESAVASLGWRRGIKKHIFTFIALSAIPFSAFAFTADEPVEGKLNTDVWYIDTEVVINGQNLDGPMPSKSKICFAPEVQKDDLRCFIAGHPNIIKWTSSSITFVPPKNVPPAGVIVLVHPYVNNNCTSLFGEQSCDKKEERIETEISTYKAHPHIVAVYDKATGKVAHNLQSGRTYVVSGYRFGDFGFGIYLGNWLVSKNDILSWTHDTVTFTPSEIPAKADELRVHNGGGKGNPWKLTSKDDMSSIPPAPAAPTATGSTATGAVFPDQVPVTVAPDDGTIFADVPTDHPYFSAVTWATAVGVVSGYEDGSFRPERSVSRAEFLKMMMATNTNLSLPESDDVLFSDVRPREWFSPYITFAVGQKLASGYKDGTFRPNASVTLGEALKMMYRFFLVPTVDPTGEEWYSRYAEHAAENKILFSQDMNPEEELSRKDTVWMLLQILQWKSRQMCVETPSETPAK